jgi:hypothetical protein
MVRKSEKEMVNETEMVREAEIVMEMYVEMVEMEIAEGRWRFTTEMMLFA